MSSSHTKGAGHPINQKRSLVSEDYSPLLGASIPSSQMKFYVKEDNPYKTSNAALMGIYGGSYNKQMIK